MHLWAKKICQIQYYKEESTIKVQEQVLATGFLSSKIQNDDQD